MSGLLVIDKPQGITSHDVVARARKALGTKKVGHAGTLDPMATGVLILGVEKATRLLGHLALETKTYEATIRFGESSSTDDAEGVITREAPAGDLTRAQLEEAVKAFKGTIEQVPSSVSAIKVDGKRAYQRVRDGEEVELKARSVTISELAINDVRSNEQDHTTDVDVTVACSSGTYIRALARDLGAALGTGAHLTMLRRTSVGPFQVSEAKSEPHSDDLIQMRDVATRCFTTWHVTSDQAQDMVHGKPVTAPEELPGGTLAAITDQDLIALVEHVGSRVKYLAVFGS